MHDANASPNSPEYEGLRNASMDTEVLIGRLVDGEAGPDDDRRFAALADADPLLWRRLALRQKEMAVLARRVDHELASADAIDLPRIKSLSFGQARWFSVGRNAPWFLGLSGWAAVVILGAVWSYSQLGVVERPKGTEVRSASDASAQMSPDEHLREYLRAQYVMGELPPALLQTEQLSDGRVAVRFLRRIEEIAFLPPGAPVPVDDSGNLTKQPSQLRGDDLLSKPQH